MELERVVERLLKVASNLEKEAEENTYFVCLNCNHTATLADINIKRKVAAEKQGFEDVIKVTVNDIIKCAACGGKMMYIPTEDSEKYYVEASDEKLEVKDIEKEPDEEDKIEEKDEEYKVEEEKKKSKSEMEFTPPTKGVVEEVVTDKEEDKGKKEKDEIVKLPKREPPKFEKVTDKDACYDEDFFKAVKKYII